MDSKKKNIYRSIFIIICILASVIILPNFIISFIGEVTGLSFNQLEVEEQERKVTVMAEYIKEHEDGSMEITQFNARQLAAGAGRDFYCTEYGIVFEKGDGLRLSIALNYGTLKGDIDKVKWPKLHSQHSSFPYNGMWTYPYLQCTNQHDNLTDKSGTYYPDAAYILTFPTLGEWSNEKQEALWETGYSLRHHEQEDITGAGLALYQEAEQYKDFYDKITEVEPEEGEEKQENTINPQDYTDYDNVNVSVDTIDEELIIGPLSIDYINGTYPSGTFGGISDIYAIGYNQEGEVVQERIELTEYIYENRTYEFDFFKPNHNNESLVDYTDQVYPKGRTAGEEYFYIKVPNPNQNATTNPEEEVAYVKIHIDFQWMSAYALVCNMDGWIYQVNWDHTHTMHAIGLFICVDCHLNPW